MSTDYSRMRAHAENTRKTNLRRAVGPGAAALPRGRPRLRDLETAGFNIKGLSLGTLVTAMQLAPGVPIPRELLYAVNARVQPPAPPDGDPDAEPDRDDGTHYFSHAALLLADETIEHLRRAGMFVRHPDENDAGRSHSCRAALLDAR